MLQLKDEITEETYEQELVVSELIYAKDVVACHFILDTQQDFIARFDPETGELERVIAPKLPEPVYNILEAYCSQGIRDPRNPHLVCERMEGKENDGWFTLNWDN